ncbi:anhydro-N-acetylmuramic acid kinase [Caldivirga sp. UBA161]|uniref:anhydro-N-acetylmuramic acid kinase n=1 Tax=Caldivirga sp. UBA161 TaxID=1915569 RepID=UPI0025BFA042|nr:anhydro-N-acetylmuramic acid kinase [Caldivirga sp. UBA161]
MRFLAIVTGTSSDGADVTLIDLQGCGKATRFKIINYVSYSYPEWLRRELLRVSSLEPITAEEFSKVHWDLGRFLADNVVSNFNRDDYDIIVYSGYTAYHGPSLGRRDYGTLQIGEASVIYARTLKTVVYDFRANDVAAGGLGAPLIALSDALLFHEGTLTINIGGISNVTYIGRDGVIAFDTGPGNILINLLTDHFYGEPYDKGGLHASNGHVIKELITELMQDDYFKKPPPKNTGREYFGLSFMRNRILPYLSKYSSDDLIRTATRFTAESIHDQVRRFINGPIREVVIGGGGTRNPILMSDLRELLRGLTPRIKTFKDYGIDDLAREGLGFAIIANEALHLRVGNTEATGGSPIILGKIIPGANFINLIEHLRNDKCSD